VFAAGGADLGVGDLVGEQGVNLGGLSGGVVQAGGALPRVLFVPGIDGQCLAHG